MRRLPILLACMGISACAPGEDATFNASEEARRAAEAARMAGTEQDPAESAAPEAWTKGAMVAAADPRAVVSPWPRPPKKF